jgi:hypothetical protein
MKVLVHKRDHIPARTVDGQYIPACHPLVSDYEGWLFGISSDGNATDGIDTMAVVMKPDGFFAAVPVSWAQASPEAVHDRYAKAIDKLDPNINFPY